MARDDEALRAAAEQSAAVLAAAGFPRMPARVLMAVFGAEEGGLTAAELATRLGVSAAAISGAVRYLQTIGIVHRISRPDSRRDRYEPPPDAWYTTVMSRGSIYVTLATLAEEAVTAIDDPGSAASARFEEMARFYRFIDARMPVLMDEWERLRSGD